MCGRTLLPARCEQPCGGAATVFATRSYRVSLTYAFLALTHSDCLPSLHTHCIAAPLSLFLFVPLFSRYLYSPSLCFSVLVTLSVLICLSLLLKWINQFLFFLLSRLSSPSFFCLAHRPFNPPFAFSQRVLFTVMFSFWSLVEDNRKVHSLIIRLPLILLIFVFIDSSLVY